ncbi:MAG: hypothetical protein MUC67_13580 [Acidobacteria bacterium]|nr:hypothetical protein [Acidobacteriota bacterium]MCU0254412.1 hypothetical protein [Acidobacteriota bacterium]
MSNSSFVAVLFGFFALMWGLLAVSDLVFVAVVVGFFTLTWGFLVVCDRSRESFK